MAKFVIAGRADCPYYAKAELLADYLQKNLPHFRIHKIPQHPDNWEHYYNITSDMLTAEMLLIAKENLQTQVEVEAEEEELKGLINPMHIWVNRAASHISYFLIPFLVNGEIFGMDNEISLHLLDRSNRKEVLEGVVMETQDLAFPLLRSVTMHTTEDEAFLEADVIILLDDVLQETIPTLEDCIHQVTSQCEVYGPLIEKNAKSSVKVIVVGKTFANLKTLMIMTHAPTINPKNIVTVATLLENEAKALLARKLNMYATGIKNLVVWGNVSGSTFIDLSKAKLYRYESAIWGPPSFFRPLMDMLFDREWMRTEFVSKLGLLSSWGQHCSGMMPVHAVVTLLRYWYQDSPPGEIVSLGIISEGHFGIPEGIVYSMPVKFQNGTWEVLTEVEVSEKDQEYLKILAFELLREKQVALGEIEEMYPQRRGLKLSSSAQESALEKEGQSTAEDTDFPTELSQSKSEEGNIDELAEDNAEDASEVSPSDVSPDVFS
ncbi:hypothetical protein lerEdw1_004411 [Lerista edwardsae]|nr:hypothetical protein lerEdw1_004411 [Lerista edwardsae]